MSRVVYRRSIEAVAIAIIAVCGSLALPAAPADLRLIDAIKTGNRPALQSLLKQRALVNAAEADGSTPLHWAVRLDQFDMVQMLLRSGAQVDAKTRYGIAPLALAAINGSAPVVDALLKAGADPNTSNPDGETVLMLAARTGKSEPVQLLIARGADVNAREAWQGETALMWAAAEDHPEVVKLLASRGADLNAKSKVPEFPKVKVDAATMVTTALPRGGMTALMLAARQGAPNGIRALIETGADLNAVDPDGTTALVLAVINAHYEEAIILIEAGANLNLGDAAGMPRDYVKGKALFVYFSYGETPEGSTSVRWARILHQIH